MAGRPKKRLTGLNAMQELFCKEFITDEKFNGLQACIRAGYSKKTAQQQSSKLLSLVKVQERIAQLMSDRVKRTEINADYVLKRLVEIDSLDILDIVEIDDSGRMKFKPLPDWPKKWRTSISGIDIKRIMNTNNKDEDIETLTSKIKWPDKTKNLELLGKHTNVSAFAETLKLVKDDYEIPEGTTPQDAMNTYLDAMKNES